MMAYTVVWFKRDLRVEDHAPLLEAARQGPVLCLYVVEPSLWAQPDCALQHYQFLAESLRDLAYRLKSCGAPLQLAVGEVPAVLDRLFALQPFSGLYAHEETGNGHTYARDRAVANWCRRHAVAWKEWPQHGVVRRLPSRDHWSAMWHSHMHAPLLPAPLPNSLQGIRLPWRDSWPAPEALGLEAHDPPLRQRGGRSEGARVFQTFITSRCRHYRGGISSPLTAPDACSRLSPYLALGCLGMREVVQATESRLQQLNDHPGAKHERQGLVAFMSRLHWHCHFIQKLESQPSMEFENLHRGYDGLREADWRVEHFEALRQGRTGWPLVDACVAMLHETGWINFRMRAMLVSVASYALWLHWRPVGEWLARQFLDYEPGIHWSQMQMQAGTTGINTTRVYNPIKQAQDHDPDGVFVRHWIPAMRRVPPSWLFEPWHMPAAVQRRCGVYLGSDLPLPLVDLAEATRQAKHRLHTLRAQPHVRAAKAAIVDKHGSRLHRPVRVSANRGMPSAEQQSLDF